MNCLEIIRNHLVDNGFDGLHKDGECGCKLSDLAPCEEDISCCTPGYLQPGDDDFDFYIGDEKQKTHNQTHTGK